LKVIAKAIYLLTFYSGLSMYPVTVWIISGLRSSGVSMQNCAHGKISMCALSNNLNVKYRHNFYEDKP